MAVPNSLIHTHGEISAESVIVAKRTLSLKAITELYMFDLGFPSETVKLDYFHSILLRPENLEKLTLTALQT